MKRNSWHYKLAEFAYGGNYLPQMNICRYIQLVIKGVGLALGLALVAFVIVGWLGLALYETFGAIFDFAEIGPAAGVLYGVLVLSGGTFLFVQCSERWELKRAELLLPSNESFASSVYKRYKQKVCFTVTFDDEA